MQTNRTLPSVAVIIPFYNGSKWIERAAKSVVEQTVKPAEFIVVNDGSRAEEREALTPFAEKYGFLILDKENGGQGSARNAGVSASASDYICFLDQDDFYIPEHIEILLRAVPRKDRRFGFVYGDAIEADGDGKVMCAAMIKAHNPSHPKRSIIEMLRNDMFILPSASLISKSAFQSVGGFDQRFTGYEDDDLFLRLFRNGYTQYFVDRPVYVWCIHEESTSYTVRMSRSRFLYFTKLCETFPDDKNKDRYYFRDCLAPRFGQAFIADAIKASRKRSGYRAEINAILRKYAAAAYANPYVGLRYKLKLWLITSMLTSLPSSMINVIAMVTRLPVVRRLRRWA